MSPGMQSAIVALIFEGGDVPEGLEETGLDGLWVPANQHHALAELLVEQGFRLYVTVVASHWLEQPASKKRPEAIPEHMQVATVLRNPDKGATATFSWRVKLAMDEEIDSLVDLFAGAAWQEREQFDLVGVRFAGHPDLRRLMMSEDWVGHPLRKDYAIDTPHHPWR